MSERVWKPSSVEPIPQLNGGMMLTPLTVPKIGGCLFPFFSEIPPWRHILPPTPPPKLWTFPRFFSISLQNWPHQRFPKPPKQKTKTNPNTPPQPPTNPPTKHPKILKRLAIPSFCSVLPFLHIVPLLNVPKTLEDVFWFGAPPPALQVPLSSIPPFYIMAGFLRHAHVLHCCDKALNPWHTLRFPPRSPRRLFSKRTSPLFDSSCYSGSFNQ